MINDFKAWFKMAYDLGFIGGLFFILFLRPDDLVFETGCGSLQDD